MPFARSHDDESAGGRVDAVVDEAPHAAEAAAVAMTATIEAARAALRTPLFICSPCGLGTSDEARLLLGPASKQRTSKGCHDAVTRHSQCAQPFHFGALEFAPRAGLESFERQPGVPAAMQAAHRMPDRLEHALHLPVAALVDDQLDRVRAEAPDVRR